MAKTLGIEFAKGYNRPFADFKKEFENTKVFRDMVPEKREKELLSVHKELCSEFYKKKANGNANRTVRKSKKTDSSKDS